MMKTDLRELARFDDLDLNDDSTASLGECPSQEDETADTPPS